jgi:hypothetical protein
VIKKITIHLYFTCIGEQYKMLVEEVNELSQEWIETWTEACEVSKKIHKMVNDL